MTTQVQPDSLATTSDDAPGSLLGYIVAIREKDEWVADWDGLVHKTLEDGLNACHNASAGYDAVLGELRIK